MDRMTVTMGGRVAEQIFFGQITTGARDDLQKITDLAYKMIKDLGMNKEVGNVSYGQFEAQFQPRIYSDETAEMIDREANKLIETAYQRAFDIITTHRDMVERLAKELLEKENLQPEVIKLILGERPFACDNKATDFYEAIYHDTKLTEDADKKLDEKKDDNNNENKDDDKENKENKENNKSDSNPSNDNNKNDSNNNEKKD